MLTHLFNLNCHQAAVVESTLNGGEVHYGWAVGPSGRAQHAWVVREGVIVDLFRWTDHEDLGVREITPADRGDLMSYITGEVGIAQWDREIRRVTTE